MFHERDQEPKQEDVKEVKHSKLLQEELRMKKMGLKRLSKYEQTIQNDPKRISKYNVFYSNMSYSKLVQNNIKISPSVSHKRPATKIYVGGDQVRMIKKGEGRSLSTVR